MSSNLLSKRLLPTLVALIVAAPGSAFATPGRCRGRCVLLGESEGSGTELIYLDELGLVEGVKLDDLGPACDALAARRSEARARGYVVESLSTAPRGTVKAVVDHRAPTSCDRVVDTPTTSETSFGTIAKNFLVGTLEIVANLFASPHL